MNGTMHHLKVISFDKVLISKKIDKENNIKERAVNHCAHKDGQDTVTVSTQREIKTKGSKVVTNIEKKVVKKRNTEHSGFRALKKPSLTFLGDLVQNRSRVSSAKVIAKEIDKEENAKKKSEKHNTNRKDIKTQRESKAGRPKVASNIENKRVKKNKNNEHTGFRFLPVKKPSFASFGALVRNRSKVLIAKESDKAKKAKKKAGKSNVYKNGQETVSKQKEIKRQKPKVVEKKKKNIEHNGLRALTKLSFGSLGDVKNRTQGSFLKSVSTFKTISLDDIKKTLISNLNAYRQRIRQKQSTKCNIPPKNNVKSCGKSQDDIKVFYGYGRPKRPEGDRNITKNTTKSKHFIRRSSSDVFGVENANRMRKNTYYFFKSRNPGLFRTPKRRKKKQEPFPCIVHQAYPSSVLSCRSEYKQEATADHYNVVGFPRQSKVDILECELYVPKYDHGIKPRVDRHCDNIANIHSDSLLKSQPSSPSIVLVPVGCSGDVPKRDCACSPPTSTVRVNKIEQCPGDENDEMKSFWRSNYCNFNNYLRPIKAKCILKHLLITLTVIAWSPCLIVVAISWLLVYPLKLRHVLKEDRVMEPTCAQPRKKKNVCTRLLEWTARTSRRAICMVYVVYKSSIGKKKCEKPSRAKEPPCAKKISPFAKKSSTCMFASPSNFKKPCKSGGENIATINGKNAATSSKWKPDPTRRYVLFFDKDRGWLMKPVKNEVSEGKRPEICQKLSFKMPESQSYPSKVVTFLDDRDQTTSSKPINKYNHECDCLPKSYSSKQTNYNYPEDNPRDKYNYTGDIYYSADRNHPTDQNHPTERNYAVDHKYSADYEYSEDRNPKMQNYPTSRNYADDRDYPADRKYEEDPDYHADRNYPTDRKYADDQDFPADNDRPVDNHYPAHRKFSADPQNHPTDQRFLPEYGYVPKNRYSKASQLEERELVQPSGRPAHRIDGYPEPAYDAPDHRRLHQRKPSRLHRGVVCPPSLCRRCPKRKKILAHKKLQISKDCRLRRSSNIPIRRKICKCHSRPPVRTEPPSCKIHIPPRPRYRSKAPAQYSTVECKKDNEKGSHALRDCWRSLGQAITSAESAWDDFLGCDHMYISTLRKRPCFWIYRKCSSVYPAFLTCHNACCQCGYVLMMMLSLSLWCPIFLSCYLCCTLFCGCCD